MDEIRLMQSMNFEFLRPENETLANLAGLAEAVLFIDPGSALTRVRSFAEELTKAIYKEERLPRVPRAGFYELVKNPVFEDCVSKSLIHQINYLRVLGNDPAHGATGELRNAQIALGTAHQLATYMAVKYYGKSPKSIPPFKDIPDPTQKMSQLNQSVSAYEKDLKKQQDELERVVAELEKERIKNAAKAEEPTEPEQTKRKQQSQAVADSLNWNEAKTRQQLIDAMLIQAGWDISNPDKVGQEYEVAFPNNPSGKGFVDYVLWGDNGQPLAVVEAKKSGNKSLHAGREQARLYADA
jgi:type I restriction enzyme R subunit